MPQLNYAQNTMKMPILHYFSKIPGSPVRIVFFPDNA